MYFASVFCPDKLDSLIFIITYQTKSCFKIEITFAKSLHLLKGCETKWREVLIGKTMALFYQQKSGQILFKAG